MEELAPAKRKKKYFQADFLSRPILPGAAALFLLFQILKLIRLFSDAVAYSKAHGIAPEEFTMGAVLSSILLAVLAGWLLFMLLRQRRGTSRLRRGNRFLLMDFLLIVYGGMRAIGQLVLFFQNFEILFLLDVLALAGGLVAPAIILFLADKQRIPPGDILLLIIGAGAIGFSALGFVMVAISIGKDYTVAHAIPELAFRLGVLLMGIATIRTALKLRAEMPIAEPVARPDKPAKPKKPKKEFHIKLFDYLPGYDDEEPEGGLFDDEPEDDAEDEAPADTEPDEPPAMPVPEPPRPSSPARPARPRPVPDGDGKVACAFCGRRYPPYLGVCPYCGRDMDADPEEPFMAEEAPPAPRAAEPSGTYATDYGAPPAKRAPAAGQSGTYATDYGTPPAERPRVQTAPAARPARDDGKVACAFCGRRYPPYLGVCPYCGQYPGGESPAAKPPEPPAPRATAPAPRAEGEARRTRDTRVVCPDCGMRFPPYLGVCPRCGRDLFEE